MKVLRYYSVIRYLFKYRENRLWYLVELQDLGAGGDSKFGVLCS